MFDVESFTETSDYDREVFYDETYRQLKILLDEIRDCPVAFLKERGDESTEDFLSRVPIP